MITIYVGNLDLCVSESDIQNLFGVHGEVQKITLLRDETTGDFRGFCFVEMANEEALAAIADLDGFEYRERVIRVNEARDRGAKAPRRAY